MGQIFLSYAREDERTAAKVAHALELAGFAVWWDRRLTGGSQFSDAIEKEIARADRVIVIWSEAANKSPWVRDEAAAGRDSDKLLPLSVGGALPPLGFRQFHTINLDGWLASDEPALVTELAAALGIDPAPPAKANTQTIRFCRADDGVTLAWSAVGDGPPMLKLSNWLNHLEHEWGNPMWQHMLDFLSDGRKLVRYDQRGNGMSDWKAGTPTVDRLVEDARVVADAAGIERFDLFGLSQGALFAIPFAARYPERVRKLVIVNGFAFGWKFDQSAKRKARWDAMMTLIGTGWGTDNEAFRQLFTSQFFPHASPQQSSAWNELQRVSGTAENAEMTLRMLADADVRDLLGQVRAPTLVLHSRGDRLIPFEAGRQLASAIPNAEFVPLESDNHLPLPTDAGWPVLKDRVSRFLAD